MNPKDQIKQTLSILDVVSTYVRLEKSGSQFKGRCPFHNEKTPSFYISQERGTYHCFGCSEHGDIFSFIEKMESVPFYEALTILAERAGIKLTPFKKEEKDKESNLINLLQRSATHYSKNLQNSADAKMYLGERGLTNETIKKFNIGFALGGEAGWRDLFINLSKEGFSPEEMIAAGVVVKKEGQEKYFDRFRGRIMFPIKNTFGNVVGFSARILPKFDDGKIGKYINSPETVIYHKSKILFGYNLAKKSIAEKKEVILVEGQMDLIMSHQVGVENIVATSGTAVTEEHVKILKRFADRVLLSFDQDTAGETAMKKCALLALYGGLDVYIIPKKEGVKDTADLIKDFGGKEWESLISRRVHLIEYLLSNIFKSISDERERGKMVRAEILPFLKAIESDIDRAYFIKLIAQKLSIQEIDIINDIKKIKVEDNFVKEEKIETNNNENISKKIKLVKEIFAILKWKNIEEGKFLHKFFEDDIDIKENILEDKKNIPEEIIEKEIIKVEREFSKNSLYKENENKFINQFLFDLSKSYKVETIKEKINLLEKQNEEDSKNKEKDLKNIIILYKKLHEIKSEKFIKI